jgi:hypothetical protein
MVSPNENRCQPRILARSHHLSLRVTAASSAASGSAGLHDSPGTPRAGVKHAPAAGLTGQSVACTGRPRYNHGFPRKLHGRILFQPIFFAWSFLFHFKTLSIRNE